LRFKPNLPVAQIRALFVKYGLSSGTHKSAAEAGEEKAGASGESSTHYQQASASTQTEKPQHSATSDVAVVWKLTPQNTLEPVRIRMGITDHTVTQVAQVLKGQLNPGDELITGSMQLASGGHLPGIRR
jgi:hypothetical protein